MVAVALLLSGRKPGESAAMLAAFGVVTAAVWWALRLRRPWFSRLVDQTLHSSGQFAVRFVMLLLARMLALASASGFDYCWAALAAGVLTRLVLNGAAPKSRAEVLGKMEGLGFGFLVPLFYVSTGIGFDLHALL